MSLKQIKIFLIFTILFNIIFSNILYSNEDNKVYVIKKSEFQEVNRWYAGYIKKAVNKANKEKADLIILELDTPGGLLSSALSIKNYLIESNVPVVVYINKNALSAGALISLSAEEIFMSSGSVIGAATPVYLKNGEMKKASEKEISAMRAAMRSCAEINEKNIKAAEAMVDESIVLNKESDGIDLDDKTLLTLSADEAIRINIANKKANSIKEIIEFRGLSKNSEIITIEEEKYDFIIKFLLNPAILSLLLSIGVAGLVLEMKTSGFGVGGITSLIAFSAFFFAQFLSGDSNLISPAIFVLSIILILLELFVIPGFGISGILGIIGIMASIFLSFGLANITAAFFVFFLSLIFDIILIGFILKFMSKSKSFNNRMTLKSDTSGYKSSVSYEHLLNKEGIADTFFKPSGYIIIDNNRYDAVSNGEFIEKDSRIKVIQVEGNIIYITKI